ncbi:competence protein CoiA family protein [Bacillus sp. FJAT-49736]|uniref:competence protein CoiA n=1 Tax=Bacillus sp. FJAT-49736 TaxID=2833582 RepID=UPI001BCA1B82|nr:competence protein CoiA family protein [Bacillus sp. FJAT-49736]MBS4172051.1 competence protein CoiA [Bacillus sp. FJAT-49736]
MLTALTKEGKIYNVAGVKNIRYLQYLKMNRLFFCPVCRERVILKVGSYKIPHFAHQRSASCLSVSEPETLQHMQGKQDLFFWLINQGYVVHLEKYLPKIKQRPDILLSRNGKWFAIEYQCSSISVKLLEERSNGYRSQNITPIWIIGGYPFQKGGNGFYWLNEFHWSFIQATEKNGFIINSYTPENKCFHFLSNISPISSRKVQANYQIKLLSKMIFPIHHFPKLEKIERTDDYWFYNKRQWLNKKIMYGKAFQDPFLLSLYESNCHPQLLPPILGIRVDFMGICQTHPAVWQFYIWLDCLRALKIGERFTFNQVLSAIKKRTSNNHIQFRILPFVPNYYQNRMVYQYLLALVEYSYLSEIRKGIFVLHKTIAFPKTMEEVFSMEKEFVRK